MGNQTHGIVKLKRAISEVSSRGLRVIDTRTRVGKSLMEWRTQLVSDLGGSECLSTQQIAIVDLCVRTGLLLEVVDAYLVRQPNLVNRRTRALFPIVMQRITLADAMVRYLGTLGLKRQPRDITLHDVLRKHDLPA